MAAEMLLINPAKRRKARKTKAKRVRVRRASTSVAPRRRRRNPIAARSVIMGRRVRRVRHGRRRNPISLGFSSSSIINTLKDAAIGGAGAVAIDALMGQVNSYLPATMQRVPGQLGLYDAVKAGITIAAGVLGKKATKGLSVKLAAGALTVQAADAMRMFVPATMPLGYAGVTPTFRGSARVGPNSRVLNAGGYSPMLNAYPRDNGVSSPMLNGSVDTLREREGNHYR